MDHSFSIDFSQSQVCFDILIFETIMQHAPYTSKRVLIIGKKSYLANTPDQDGILPRLLIHA